LPRGQIVFFAVLLIISITFLSLGEHTKLTISTRISPILLFPVRTITALLDFLTVSSVRITELETTVNKLRLENAECKKIILLDTTHYRTTMYQLKKAQIIGRDPSNINGYLYIDVGQNAQVRLEQPVLSIDGLVGKTKYVGDYYTIVETIEKRGFAVSALDANAGIHGIVKNQGNLIFDFVRIEDELFLGDSIFTSGMSNIFPEGILIGTVKRIDESADQFFKPVYIKPSVRINRLNYVYLVYGNGSSTENNTVQITDQDIPDKN
jgi:rod shape-determining protein MreC